MDASAIQSRTLSLARTARSIAPSYAQPAPRALAIEQLLDCDPAIIRGMARGVEDALANGPLTLAARDRLIGRAQRLGIGRFDANLIVASVEHRMRASRMKIAGSQRRHFSAGDREGASDAAGALSASAGAVNSGTQSIWTTRVAAMLVQGAIIAGAWWLLH